MRKLCRPGFSYAVTVKKKESNLNYTVLTRVILKALIIIPLIYNFTYAADEDYFAEDDFFGDSPIVLTVSRMHKPLAESPASVTVIDRQMIRDSGARELSEIFRMVPGFFVGHNFSNGNKPVVVYQGLGEQFYKQFQVLVDGRSVFIPSYGGVPWSRLPLLLEDIERVEVTRGPNAVTYGANAFLATINIITRHAAEDSGFAVSYLNDLNNSNKTQDLYVRMGNQIGDLDWRITAGRESNSGSNLYHDSYVNEKLNFRTDFLTAYNQFWTIQAGIVQSTINLGDGSFDDLIRDEDSSNSYQNIKWEMAEDHLTTSMLLSHSRFVVEDAFETTPLNTPFAGALTFLESNGLITLPLPDFTGIVDFDRITDRVDFEIFQNRKINDMFTINYGLSLRKDEVTSFYFFHDNETHTIDTNRVLSSLEWKPIDDITIDLGVILEKTNFTEQESSHRLTLIKKQNNHHIRLVTSTAKRNPVLWELFGFTQFDIDVPGGIILKLFVWDGNEQLKPENIQSTEIGVFSNYLDKQLTTDIKLFSYTISDQYKIDRNPPPASAIPVFYFPDTVRSQVNEAKTEVNGLELSVNFSPAHKTYRVYGGLSKTSVKSNDLEKTNSYPEFVSFIGGHFNINRKHQVSGLLHRVDDLEMLDTNPIEAYTRVDLRYQFTINPVLSTKLELIGQNLYENHDDYGLGREQEKSYLLRVSSQF